MESSRKGNYLRQVGQVIFTFDHLSKHPAWNTCFDEHGSEAYTISSTLMLMRHIVHSPSDCNTFYRVALLGLMAKTACVCPCPQQQK